MNPKSIVIASVLKTVKDTRLYEKIGQSLAKHFPETKIHLIGFQILNKSSVSEANKNIAFYPIFNFSRLSFRRFFANWFFLLKILKIKPKILIISTFELLPSAIFYKIFFQTKLIYDVQENYYFNLKYTQVFPPILRDFLAFGVRMIEYLASYWIDFYLLAEKCYADELPFLGKKYEIVENKMIRQQTTNHRPQAKELVTSNLQPVTLNFLYSGTIAQDYGIFEAIEFMEKMYLIDNQINMKIIGYCPKQANLEKLKIKIKDLPYIQLIGGKKPVSHQIILTEMKKADFALLPYQLNQSFQNRIPTKFYEYLHFRVPMLIQTNATWEEFLQKYNFKSAIFLNFNDLSNLSNIYQQLKSEKFYENVAEIADIYWESEEKKLILLITKLTN